jgi:hypothetical protein
MHTVYVYAVYVNVYVYVYAVYVNVYVYTVYVIRLSRQYVWFC